VSSEGHHYCDDGECLAVRSEDLLSAAQAELLWKADPGEVPCPNCGQALSAKMVVSTVPDLYADVMVYCTDGSCGFIEF
jgi:hypothetical protein